MSDSLNPSSDLHTLRDFLRLAVSRFNAANLVYGHGTHSAFDEAAFLVLEGLRLPVDNLEPFLDARLLPEEKQKLASLIDARISTRKPLPYLLNKAYIQGVPFYVDERVIVPRSFIGELLAGDIFAGSADSLVADPGAVNTLLSRLAKDSPCCPGAGCFRARRSR